MQEPRAQRTLVKSPPELWAEVSDVEALARHLGEFGEIRITRLDPETTVAWEGDRACGTVALEPSGWGTKVTITAKLAEQPAPEAVAAEPELEAVPPAPAAEAVPAEPAPDALEPVAPEAEATAEPAPDAPEPDAPEPVAEPDAPEPLAEASPEADAPEPGVEAPKVGFFARLFGRRRKVESVVGVDTEGEPDATAPEPEVLAPEPAPVAAEPEPLAAETEADTEPLAAEPEADKEPLAAEPEAAAEPPEPEPEPVAAEPEPEAEPQPAPLDAERAEAILTGVLDDLGSAHHRPFSRA
jgi:hypothetical protein